MFIVFCLFTYLRFTFCIITNLFLIRYVNKEEMDLSELT